MAEEVEDALKRVGRMTSNNGPTAARTVTLNDKLRKKMNGEPWLPTFGSKRAHNYYYYEDAEFNQVVKFKLKGQGHKKKARSQTKQTSTNVNL